MEFLSCPFSLSRLKTRGNTQKAPTFCIAPWILVPCTEIFRCFSTSHTLFSDSSAQGTIMCCLEFTSSGELQITYCVYPSSDGNSKDTLLDHWKYSQPGMENKQTKKPKQTKNKKHVLIVVAVLFFCYFVQLSIWAYFQDIFSPLGQPCCFIGT